MEEIENDNKVNIYVLLGFILFVFILFGILYFSSYYPKNTLESEVAKAEELHQFDKKVDEIIISRNFEGCDNLEDKTISSYCRDRIYFANAEDSKNIDDCTPIVSEIKDTCQESILRIQIEYELDFCDKIENQEIKQECTNSYYLQKAFESQDVNECDYSNKPELCINNFYIESGLILDYSSFDCNLLKGELEKQDCNVFKSEFDIDKESFEVCSQLTTNLIIESCYRLFNQQVHILNQSEQLLFD